MKVKLVFRKPNTKGRAMMDEARSDAATRNSDIRSIRSSNMETEAKQAYLELSNTEHDLLRVKS